MPKKFLVILAAVAASAALTGQVAAEPLDTHDDDVPEQFVPELRTERVWFTCDGETGIAQLDGTASTWSAEEPPDGGGCTSVDTTHQGHDHGDAATDAVFQGTFDGNLDSLTVHLHGIPLTGSDDVHVALGLTVDDASVVGWPSEAVVTPAQDGQSSVVEVSVSEIGLLGEADNVPHDLAVTVSLHGDPALAAWRWGDADAPSGITFHPEQLADTAIPAGTAPAPPPGEEPPMTLPAGSAVLAGPASQTLGYVTPQMAMAPNTTLSFANGDQVVHDVTARTLGLDGKPLFRSVYTSTGSVSTVVGAEALPPGDYAFYCSLHPNMTGTLHVAG